ncbi:MAG: hypothetical protein KF757_04955 [Phycisphaeraceae bacterium]|nr:hypothetical protein [Phycisphaeraceae bacterium]MCW5763884.1 hypothetical protein [Phycisphaeraceae bacterium]
MKFGSLEAGAGVREVLDECDFLLNVWLLGPPRDGGDGGAELGCDVGQGEAGRGEVAEERGFVGAFGEWRGGRRLRCMRGCRLSDNPDLWARGARVVREHVSAQRSGV